MVHSNLWGSFESPGWDFVWYTKRDRTGDTLYLVYENGGFYHFYTQDGENLHTHSVRMGLSTEGFYPCEKDWSSLIKREFRDKIADVLS